MCSREQLGLKKLLIPQSCDKILSEKVTALLYLKLEIV